MNIRTFHPMILLCVLATLPLKGAMADGFLNALLEFTGITITTSPVREPFIIGNLWLVNIDASRANEAKQITHDGAYHSPLWIPSSHKILAVKEDKLIQFNSDGTDEKVLHSVSDFTILLGFNKSDSNSILILQHSTPAVLSLASGQITRLPYNKQNPKHRDAVASVMSNFRDYRNTKVFIEKQSTVDAGGPFKPNNIIHIKVDKQDLMVSCPADCAQPALKKDGRRLVFVNR